MDGRGPRGGADEGQQGQGAEEHGEGAEGKEREDQPPVGVRGRGARGGRPSPTRDRRSRAGAGPWPTGASAGRFALDVGDVVALDGDLGHRPERLARLGEAARTWTKVHAPGVSTTRENDPARCAGPRPRRASRRRARSRSGTRGRERPRRASDLTGLGGEGLGTLEGGLALLGVEHAAGDHGEEMRRSALRRWSDSTNSGSIRWISSRCGRSRRRSRAHPPKASAVPSGQLADAGASAGGAAPSASQPGSAPRRRADATRAAQVWGEDVSMGKGAWPAV